MAGDRSVLVNNNHRIIYITFTPEQELVIGKLFTLVSMGFPFMIP